MTNAKVLVVDDDPAVLRMLTSALTTLGYEVAAAPDARQALEVAKSLPAGPDLVISDVLMPDMNGAELVREMAMLCPSTAALFISGNAGQVQIPAGAPFLEKPFSLEALAAKIREVLGASDRRCGCAGR